jgi:hypothetical protein
MDTLDLRAQYAHLFKPSAKKVELVDVPPLQFAMVDGAIEPDHGPGTSPAFQQAVEALYGISYTLKFASKLRPERPIDYRVMALEGLWGFGPGPADITRPDSWVFTAMIMQPEHIDAAMFAQALAQLRAKKPNPALDKLRLETFCEGLCVQTMHVGPYATEPETVARMETFAREQGYTMAGRHHEIYLGDPRRAAPDKLKTVLRHAVTKAG